MIEIISWKYHDNIIVISWENVDFESYGRESIVTRPQKNKSIFHYIYHRNIIVLIVISLPLLLPSRFPSFPLFLYLAWRAVRMAGPWDNIMEISWKYHGNIMVISWKDTVFQPYGRQWPDVWLKQATFHYNYCIKINLLMPSRYFLLYL